MLLETLTRRLSALAGKHPWNKKHIYVMTRNPKTGLYERTYLDLRYEYDTGRPYFVPCQNQDKIRARERKTNGKGRRRT